MRLLSLQQLSEKLGGRSRSSIFRDVDNGRLPRPIKLGARNYWEQLEVEKAIAELRSVRADNSESGAT